VDPICLISCVSQSSTGAARFLRVFCGDVRKRQDSIRVFRNRLKRSLAAAGRRRDLSELISVGRQGSRRRENENPLWAGFVFLSPQGMSSNPSGDDLAREFLDSNDRSLAEPSRAWGCHFGDFSRLRNKHGAEWRPVSYERAWSNAPRIPLVCLTVGVQALVSGAGRAGKEVDRAWPAGCRSSFVPPVPQACADEPEKLSKDEQLVSQLRESSSKFCETGDAYLLDHYTTLRPSTCCFFFLYSASHSKNFLGALQTIIVNSRQ